MGALMTEYRASFDAVVRFSNGGDLIAHGFRVDLPSPELDGVAIRGVGNNGARKHVRPFSLLNGAGKGRDHACGPYRWCRNVLDAS